MYKMDYPEVSTFQPKSRKDYWIQYADIVGNAFITVLDSDKPRRYLSCSEIENYIKNLKRVLEDEGIYVAVCMSRNNTYNFFKEFKEYFVMADDGIELQDGITRDDLTKEFVGHLPLDVLVAMRDISVVMSLLCGDENGI